MVIKRFIDGDPVPGGERFARSALTLPEAVVYQASWVNSAGTGRCQFMEAGDSSLFDD